MFKLIAVAIHAMLLHESLILFTEITSAIFSSIGILKLHKHQLIVLIITSVIIAKVRKLCWFEWVNSSRVNNICFLFHFSDIVRGFIDCGGIKNAFFIRSKEEEANNNEGASKYL
jgi:hypothetical protein